MNIATSIGIPANRQSLVETAACPHSYAVQVIEGRTMPSGLQSARGTEIHQVMSRYIAHCATRKSGADWAAFDRLALGAGEEAARILNGMRDSYEVDWQHSFGTELTLSCDTGHACGTLDHLLLFLDVRAKIEDFKSHPGPFEPNTDQAKRYAFLVFENFPRVEEVTFELVFVRYANCRRSVTFTRSEDYATLRQHIINTRIRQEEIHAQYERGETLPAHLGNHCQYCPLLQTPTGCPISEFNPHVNTPIEERARWAIFLAQQKTLNDEVLKAFVNASGEPIRLKDGNGRITEIGFRASESRQYPLPMVLDLLNDWQHASGEDLKPKLLVSSTKLKQYASAKKRAVLDQALQDAAPVVTKTKFEIHAPAETETETRVNEWEE